MSRLARLVREPRLAWPAIVARLDRPGRRWLLAPAVSLRVTAIYRRPCLVYWRDGVWIHHYRGARIPHAAPGRAAPPDVFTAEARDLFLHGYTPHPGDVVFDVGAGIGAETLVFSRLVGPSGRVISLEAHPRTYERLVRLCRANALSNVTPLQIAAADRDGELTISDGDSHLRNTVLGSGGTAVRARRLDALTRDLGIERIDLLKMNIEGAERPALEGLAGGIERVRHVCISCHDFLADAGGSQDMRTKAFVSDFLRAHGFRTSTRADAAQPWTRDYVYGTNTR